MPAKSTRRTLARQWELLKRLPGRGTGKTASDLVAELKDAGFDVSKRQVERDLWELLEAFNLECNDKSPPYGWKWPTGSSVDLPGMTLAEALSLRLVQDYVEQLLPSSLLKVLEPRFVLAEGKLASLRSDSAAAQWPKKMRSVPPTQPMLSPHILPDVLESVQNALLHDQQLEADYVPMDVEEPNAMRLHPLALINRGPITYLVATAWDYADVRLYALHRMTRAQCLEDGAKRPENFDLDEYISSGAVQFGTGGMLKLEARVADGLARILCETPLSADQQLVGNMLTATVQDTWQLIWWILSQAENIEVIAPKALREQVREQLARALAAYEK